MTGRCWTLSVATLCHEADSSVTRAIHATLPASRALRVGTLPLLDPEAGHPRPTRAVAGIRWTVEESLQTAKSQVGLDQHQVRRWDSWHRFTTLALTALTGLAIFAANAAHHNSADTGLDQHLHHPPG